MRHLLKSDKKGVSVLIGYILLISMAVALSVLVYNWIVHPIPSGEEVDCPDGAGLSFRDLDCDGERTQLSFDVKNTGLFDVDGYEVLVSDRDESRSGVVLVHHSTDLLEAGKTVSPATIDYGDFVTGSGSDDVQLESSLRLVELKPYKMVEGEKYYCQRTTESINCNYGEEVCTGGFDEDDDGFYDCFDYDCRYSKHCINGDEEADGLNSDHLDAYDHILAYYAFDEGVTAVGGNVTDWATRIGVNSDGEDNAEIVHDTLDFRSDEGYNDGAYWFDYEPGVGGSDENGYLELFADIDDAYGRLSPDFTIAMWVKTDADKDKTYSNGIKGKGNVIAGEDTTSANQHFYVNIPQEGESFPLDLSIEFDDQYGGKTLEVSGALKEDEWTHFVVVWDMSGGEVRVYINGSSETSYFESYNPSSVSPEGKLNLCRTADSSGDNDEGFVGYVDELILFDRSLSENEVEDLYDYYEN